MAGSEKNLWIRLRDGVKYAGDFRRIECTVEGTPDVNYCALSSEGWIELKHADKPARESTQVFKSQRGLEVEQIAWIMHRKKHGGRVFVFAQVGKALFLFDGLLAPQINTMTYGDMLKYAQWHRVGNMTHQDWASLVGQLAL